MSKNTEAVRIEGTFLGHPIDVTVTVADECDANTPNTVQDIPESAVPDATPPVGIDTSAKGEVVPADAAPDPDAATAPPADPAPAEVEVSEDAPNPAGNAEQL